MSSEGTVQSEQERRASAAGAAGHTLFAQGRFAESAARFEEALGLLPQDVDLHYNFACAAWAAGDLQRARAHLLRCIELAPELAKGHDGLARLHHEQSDCDTALQFSFKAVGLSPSEPEFLLTHAVVLESLGRTAESWEAAKPVLECEALADRAASLCARLAVQLGRLQETTALLNHAFSRPALDSRFRRQLHFAASGFFDRIGQYDDAFEHARLGHLFEPRSYDPTARRREFERRIEHWTPQRIAALPRATHGSRRPVFIIGMPRSGTSLVEQILGCHPNVFAAGELDATNRTARALDSRQLPYPASLESLTTEEANGVAEVYLKFISALNDSASHVTDKMPLNFIYLDLVQALLPESRVIHCTRDPLDTCVSVYMTEFETPYDFAGDLKNLGEFYAMYRKLMDHWQAVLPLRILDVRYEDVVSDLEGQTRQMLEFLELPWDQRCTRFHESPRVVSTASREQVRKPIYGSSVGRWKNYQQHLAALSGGLGTGAD